jgi:uncharacterized protein
MQGSVGVELCGGRPHLFSLVVKTTSACNLACSYCYVAQHFSKTAAKVIGKNTIALAIQQYAAVVQARRGAGLRYDRACFLWHGGEPTLAGIEFFQNCFETEREAFGSLASVRNCLTTNGTLLTSDWTDLFKTYSVDVSVSLDGPSDIHDQNRPSRNGGGSFSAALAAYESLRGAGLNPGIMMVVTERAAADANRIYDFFQSLKPKNLAFVPYVTRGEHISAEGYTLFLEQFFHRWLEEDREDFYVRDFDTIMTRLLGGVSSLCEYNNCCGNYLTLDVDGSIYACDLFLGDPRKKLGHIAQNHLLHILDSEKLAEHASEARALPEECRTCGYSWVCGGGCLYRRQLSGCNQDFFCVSRIRLIDRVAEAMGVGGCPAV